MFTRIKNNFLKNLKENSYISQDSKFFIATSFKMTFVSTSTFLFIFYSVWTILEMNYNFFSANGFSTLNHSKSEFYAYFVTTMKPYIYYFSALTVGVFTTGLLISHLAIRAFGEIENFCYDTEEDIDSQFQVSGLKNKKLIYQVSQIYFKYMQIFRKTGKHPKIRLPERLSEISKPHTDMVFILQYFLITTVLSILSSFVIYAFIHEIYQEIINFSLNNISGNQVIASYLQAQKPLLMKITFAAIAAKMFCFTLFSKNIIKSIEGVTFGFTRDMIKVISGNGQTRLRPRINDPGKEMAIAINYYLDSHFPKENKRSKEDQKTIEERWAPPEGMVLENDIDLHSKQTNILKLPEDFAKNEEELPPIFVQEKQEANNKIFKVTTSTGEKLECHSEEEVQNIIEKLKKSS